MNFIIQSRLLTFIFVAAIMAILTACDVLHASILSPEVIASAALMPFMLGETATAELRELLEKQGQLWEQQKKANDDRIKALEEKNFAPADIVEKVEKMNQEMNQILKDIAEVAKKSNRPQGSGGVIITPEQQEYKEAFSRFMRKGGDASQLSALEKKALGRGSDIDGGVLVHAELETEIDRVAGTVSAMRQIADVRTIGAASQKLRVKTRGTAARWVGESEAGGESQNTQYAMIEIPAEEMEAEPWVYNDTLEDADYNLESDVADEAGIAFAEAEADAFINGSGVKKPRGFLTYTNVANASYAWGKLGFITSGANGAFAASNPADKIIDLLHSLKSIYRNGSVLLMSDTTLGSLRQIKDASGSFYLFNPDPLGNFGGFVLGTPVVVDDNMPVLATNSYSIAYGNFKRAYRIVDRRGIVLIRDNITTKGTTKFNFRKRVGGGVKNFEAIKLMKFAA